MSKLFYLPSEKGSTLKGNILGANSFLLELTPFQKRSKTIMRVVSLESIIILLKLGNF